MPNDCNREDVTSPDKRNPDKQYVPLTRESLEDGYILVNTSEKTGESAFKFVSAYNVVNKFVTDALLKLTVLPTGSIHWMPVTI